MVVYICLVISICNFIAIGVALKKKRPIFKIMYFINSLGVVAISNLLVWMEGVYVDQNNLSGSTITFALNICNIIFFIVNMKHIKRINFPTCEILLDNGETLPISRGYKKFLNRNIYSLPEISYRRQIC